MYSPVSLAVNLNLLRVSFWIWPDGGIDHSASRCQPAAAPSRLRAVGAVARPTSSPDAGTPSVWFLAKKKRRSLVSSPPELDERIFLVPGLCSYSARSVCAGSIRAMRNAGTRLATDAIAISTIGAIASVTGSQVFTP